MNIEEKIFGTMEIPSLKCRRCGKPIEAGSYCEKCAEKKFGKDLTSDELQGSRKANRRHPTQNKMEVG